jgi:formylglycine-generating enzyme required for sulfatase activity
MIMQKFQIIWIYWFTITFWGMNPGHPVFAQDLLRLQIETRNASSQQAEIITQAEPGGLYHLMKSLDLSTWVIDQSASPEKGESTVRFLIQMDTAPRAFYRIEGVSIKPLDHMVRIEPGKFMMGSPDDEEGRYLDKETPLTENTLTRAYWISKYEVSQGEFETLMDFNPSRFKILNDPQLPVESVTWFSALDYCYELTLKERQAGNLTDDFEYRLPTEAEWAYAARAGTTTRFSYGDDPFYESLHEYAWYKGNSRLQPHPVGEKQPNPWGLHDIHGNVFEWCMDWFDNLPGGTLADSWGPEDGYDRVVRGGYWDSSPSFCRSALRVHHPPESRLAFIGFRIVLAPVRQESIFDNIDQ